MTRGGWSPGPDDYRPADWSAGRHEQDVPQDYDNLDDTGAGTDNPPATPTVEPAGEPVVIAQAVTAVLAALDGLGWVSVPSTTMNLIFTAVAAVGMAVSTVLARSKVWTAASVRRELARHR